MAITKGELESIARGVVEGLKPGWERLQARIKALEDRPTVRYVGTHQTGLQYQPGELLTRGGSLWLCLKATSTTPGLDDSYRLVVKQGKA